MVSTRQLRDVFQVHQRQTERKQLPINDTFAQAGGEAELGHLGNFVKRARYPALIVRAQATQPEIKINCSDGF